MKIIKKTFEPNDENELETSSPLTGAITAVVIGVCLALIVASVIVVIVNVYLL